MFISCFASVSQISQDLIKLINVSSIKSSLFFANLAAAQGFDPTSCRAMCRGRYLAWDNCKGGTARRSFRLSFFRSLKLQRPCSTHVSDSVVASLIRPWGFMGALDRCYGACCSIAFSPLLAGI